MRFKQKKKKVELSDLEELRYSVLENETDLNIIFNYCNGGVNVWRKLVNIQQ